MQIVIVRIECIWEPIRVVVRWRGYDTCTWRSLRRARRKRSAGRRVRARRAAATAARAPTCVRTRATRRPRRTRASHAALRCLQQRTCALRHHTHTHAHGASAPRPHPRRHACGLRVPRTPTQPSQPAESVYVQSTQRSRSKFKDYSLLGNRVESHMRYVNHIQHSSQFKNFSTREIHSPKLE